MSADFLKGLEKGFYKKVELDYKNARFIDVEEDNSVRARLTTPIGFEVSTSFSSGAKNNDENKNLSGLELKSKTMKVMEEKILEEAEERGADYILVGNFETNGNLGAYFLASVQYKFLARTGHESK